MPWKADADVAAGAVLPRGATRVPALAVAAWPVASAPSTARLTMRPCGPDPASAPISMPAALASRRASGEAKTRACKAFDTVAEAAPAVTELCALAVAGLPADDAAALAVAPALAACPRGVAACGVAAFGLGAAPSLSPSASRVA